MRVNKKITFLSVGFSILFYGCNSNKENKKGLKAITVEKSGRWQTTISSDGKLLTEVASNYNANFFHIEHYNLVISITFEKENPADVSLSLMNKEDIKNVEAKHYNIKVDDLEIIQYE